METEVLKLERAYWFLRRGKSDRKESMFHLLPRDEGLVLQLVFANSLSDLLAAVTRFRIQPETFIKSFICVSIALGKRFQQISSANDE